jgi:hypothetical protein
MGGRHEGKAAMDWDAAIEWNRAALLRVLAGLLAMAGLAAGGPGTLPRHLHRAVLRRLRPAEAATRRLVIAAARGLVVALAPARRRKPMPRNKTVPAPPPLTPPHKGDRCEIPDLAVVLRKRGILGRFCVGWRLTGRRLGVPVQASLSIRFML